MTHETIRSLAEEIVQIVTRAATAVVQVQASGRPPTSGIVLATDRVLVVGHTVAMADRVRVVADSRAAEGEVAGRDGASDLALVKVAGLSLEGLPTSSDPLRVGEPVSIVGRDRQGAPSASFGIIGSVTGPIRLAGGTLEQVARIDASPFRGISGAAVVGADGRLMAIANGALHRGVPYAVPISLALSVATSLAEHGRVKRGYLGIGTQPVRLAGTQRGSRDQGQGLLVVAIVEGGPADRAGLLVGDVLLSFAGRPLNVADDLFDLLTGDRVNQHVRLDIVRGDKPITLEITVGERGAR